MFKRQIWLGGLLVIQVLLATLLYWNNVQSAQGRGTELILSFDSQQVDRIHITDGEQALNLKKQEELWVLPEANNLPANNSRLKDALASLSDIQSAWPVSTSSSGQQRFEVGDSGFRRKIGLYDGENLVDELYIGSSPGFRKAHVRRGGDNEVYAATINSYDFPADSNPWLDKSLLGASGITEISGEGFAIKLVDGIWQAADDNSQLVLEIDQDKSRDLSTAFSGLRIIDLSDITPGFDVPVTSIRVRGSKEWHYELFEKDGSYLIRRDDREQIFTLSKSSYDKLINTDGVATPSKPLIFHENETEESPGNGSADG